MRRGPPLALALALAGAACPGPPVATCEGGACDGGGPPTTPPLLYVAPAFGLGFDCVAIGCDQAREVVVENRGGGLISVLSAQLTAGTSPDFAVVTAQPLPWDLGPGQATTMSVIYHPLDAEKDYGLLRVITAAQPPENSNAGPVELPLRVRQNGDPVLGLLREGAAPDERVDLASEDFTLSFGYVPGGSVGERDLIVANQTTGNAILELLEVVAGARFEPAFYITPLEPTQRFVNPGAETRVRLQLLPGSTAADLRLYDAEILVRSSDPIYPEVAVRLFGTAMNVPVLEVSPASVDLGSTRFQTPKATRLVLHNGGGVPLFVTPRLTAGANVGFAVSGDGVEMAAIGPFEQATLDLSLAATVGGAVTGVLRLDSNDPLRPHKEIPLAAFVEAPRLVVQPDPVAFGTLVQGWSTESTTVRLSNVGHGALDVQDLRFEIGSSTQFVLTQRPQVPVQLLPGDPPLEARVNYTAYTLGPAQGLLVVDSNSIDYARTEVQVTGTGVTCEAGCAMPNATPSCATGSCQIGSCASAYHDADADPKNGCECREESPEVGSFCSGAQEVGTLKESSTSRSGNLHDASDMDTYYFMAEDASDFCMPWDDDGEIEVRFTSAPSGVEFCVSYIDHQSSGSGCGLGSEQCGLRAWTFDNTSCGGDDNRDVTVRVRATPGQAPGCAEYSLYMRSSM